MPINYASIMPHGYQLITDLYPLVDEKWQYLSKKMLEIAEKIVKQEPDIIVIASPHNLRLVDHIGIVITNFCKGELFNEKRSKNVELEWKCDRDFAQEIYEQAKQTHLPVVAVNFASSEGELSSMQMDWGTLIPLHFVKTAFERADKAIPNIVLITPSREIPWGTLVQFGKVINKTSNKTNKNVVFIASADQGHSHDEKGPYGYNPASQEYDQLICEMVQNNELHKLLDLSPDFIEKAKPDSIWQMLILEGIIQETSLKNTFYAYECPSYFGMLVASYEKEKLS